ncbi:hypothetical protein [Bradyrhizobium sp. CCBAU 53380]|uniref:hypothetical protein n=1 Tax=Bradyrhizobium sp. CCBAU 53380 TaxID=1325117 RepID=UPI002302D753|nr:hypothetical protein [Bradyrhizobium sp. CCBAU 53380]
MRLTSRVVTASACSPTYPPGEEKRKWPQRQHYAVLVAEHINRRFLNVIHLLSHSIPMIAIQVSMLKVNGSRSVFFTKVLDTYEEIDDGTSLDDRTYNRDDWLKKAKWTVEAADTLLNITKPIFGDSALNYLKAYVAITVNGDNYMWLHRRTSNKSLVVFRMAQSLQDEPPGSSTEEISPMYERRRPFA